MSTLSSQALNTGGEFATPTVSDSANNSLFENAAPISTISSAGTDYFDVLPSFQMYQSILKRDNSQFNENLSGLPPTYEPQTRFLQHPPHDELETNTGHAALDNIDNMSKSGTLPVDIQIFVTKQVPAPHESNDLETRLKEYQQGDLISGYILITNTSSKPLDFGLFTVSLEGTVKNLSPIEHPNSILTKKFLRMYDLNASYGYCCVPNSAGIQYEPYTKDRFDGSELGLPNERILQPGAKYKKFFTFKLPHTLLDSACVDEMYEHCLPPPTFGLDRSSYGGKSKEIVYNKALGYGFLNTRGTPLLTRDNCMDDISISYTIEARFIDQVKNKEKENIYVISKECSYHLRFIPKLYQEENDRYSTCESTKSQMKDLDSRIQSEIERGLNLNEKVSADLKNIQLSNNFSKLDLKNIQDERKLGQKIIYNKKTKFIGLYQRAGILELSCKPFTSIIPAISPKLLRAYNAPQIDIPGVSSQLRSNSLKSLKMNLLYRPDKSNIVNSPCIEKIDIKLVSYTLNSELPFPFKFQSDFIEDFEENFNKLKTQMNGYLNFLRNNNLELDSSIYRSIRSLDMMTMKKDVIPLYEPIKFSSSTTIPWNPIKSEEDKLAWEAKLNVPLIVSKLMRDVVVPSFQTCILTRCYLLEVTVKLRGGSLSGEHDNTVKSMIPVTVA